MRYLPLLLLLVLAGCATDYPMKNCRRVVEGPDVAAEESTWVCNRPWYWPH